MRRLRRPLILSLVKSGRRKLAYVVSPWDRTADTPVLLRAARSVWAFRLASTLYSQPLKPFAMSTVRSSAFWPPVANAQSVHAWSTLHLLFAFDKIQGTELSSFWKEEFEAVAFRA
jgi:hypothetical protein